ncbi:Clp protease N-terminal domain-containing protein [Actinokineospora sp. 24-640]
MPKVNVYLPDDLAEAVRDSGVPVSAICQRALEQSVRRVTAIRATTLAEADADLPHFTDRARAAVRLGIDAARAQGAAEVGTAHLVEGILAEGSNLALRVLAALDITPARVRAALTPAEGTENEGTENSEGAGGSGERFGSDAANALELAVTEAAALGHNYIGCEHLLLGLAAEPDGPGGAALRAAGAEPRVVRSTVTAALAGYVHLRAQSGERSAAVAAAALTSLVERIEALEARLG